MEIEIKYLQKTNTTTSVQSDTLLGHRCHEMLPRGGERGTLRRFGGDIG